MNVIINGQNRQFLDNINLSTLLEACAEYRPYSAVAVNQIFIHKHLYVSTVINSNDCVEILIPMQGG